MKAKLHRIVVTVRLNKPVTEKQAARLFAAQYAGDRFYPVSFRGVDPDEGRVVSARTATAERRRIERARLGRD